MKVVLIHDYLNEFGGAEQVLLALTEIWPEAPIYTAFTVPGSTAAKAFSGKKIVRSWFSWIPFYWKLYSPLRFLIPWIWRGWDLSEYDVIISSASWFVTKGFKKKTGAIEVCYCHTPPRWLYGYTTSVNWQKWWPVKIYGAIVGHFLRIYDFNQAQKVSVFVANSKNVANRIWKFYRREATVIYPPVDYRDAVSKRGDYYLMVTRIVGAKGIELAIAAAKKYGFKLKIAGEKTGYSKHKMNNEQCKNVEYLGRVSEGEKYKLMAGAKAFLALATDEDFGITPVEAQACGTPVIAFNGGGYRETVIDGKTGVLFDGYSVEGLWKAMQRTNNLKFEIRNLKLHAKKFSKERFKKEMLQLVNRYAGTT
jgi:glycosyltransferase involved in cell wall biosynthesis